jgi:23S rRNA (guanosine2251-2'-O)-methyltransferase
MSKPKIVCGIHAVSRAVKDSPEQIQQVYISSSHRNARVAACAVHAKKAGVMVQKMDNTQLDQMSGGTRHQGVLAVLSGNTPQQRLTEFLKAFEADPYPACLLAIDGISDPHNLGACLRSAEALGAQGVIIPKSRGVQMTATVSKVACGAAERLPLFRETNLVRSLEACQKAGFWIVGTDLNATETPRSADLSGPVVVVVGSEAEGMRQLTGKSCDVNVKIPLQGAVESLNVSVACGILLYEILSQQKR